MQVPLQSCCPATLQPHEPLLQDEPLPQTAQLVPQCAESVFELQAPSEHIMLPEPHEFEHAPLLQTCPLLHLLPQLPQLLVFEATQEPLQDKSPVEQAHIPLVHVWPDLQTLPQLPQFWLSVCAFTQDPLHSIWPVLQVGPVAVAGLAQLARKSAGASTAAKAKREALRESMIRTP